MLSIRIRTLRPLALSLALALVPMAAIAQEAPRLIEQDMTPEEFRAAGLDRLSPEQLANLNAWLGRTLSQETAAAAEAAKSKVEQENRGFLPFGSDEPVVSRMAEDFTGFGKGRRYVLENGHVWEQVDSTSLSRSRTPRPEVKIVRSMIGTVWYMAIDGYNTRAKVKRIK